MIALERKTGSTPSLRQILDAHCGHAIVAVVPNEDKTATRARLKARLADLRIALAATADQVDDQVRELYSELLEEFREDSNALKQIRKLGEALTLAVERGDLPRAMVMRGTSRKPKT